MGVFDDAAAEAAPSGSRAAPDAGDTDTTDDSEPDSTASTPRSQGAASVTVAGAREATVMVDGTAVDLADIETDQPDESGNWITGGDSYGIPRGVEALENRQIVQTAAMQSIANGIVDQVLGGDLAFAPDEEVMDALDDAESESAERLRTLFRDIFTGENYRGESLDDLITAAVEDMLGPGEGIWQFHAAADDASLDLPVAAVSTLDPLTVRKNEKQNGVPKDPPYWQAQSAFVGGSISTLGTVEPTPLAEEQVAVMTYPRGNRSYDRYPISPAYQLKEWLEILANSTKHHSTFYDDNKVPPGLLQVINASDTTIDKIEEELENAKGDPRNAPVIGGEGGAQWIDMGGTSINLNVIEEQKWFFNMCLGSLGLGKHELGFTEDANRSNGEIEASRVYKRVAGPFSAQFENAIHKGMRQFEAYQDLGEPFRPEIRHTDPREERAKEERLRKQLQAGAITPRQYARRTGDQDIAADDERWQVSLPDGTTVNYGDHPRWVSERLFAAAGADPDGGEIGTDDEGDGDDGGE
jgi:hypothetical protein